MDVRLKRAYEPATSADGYRVLIDRLWPRGISRERAKLDSWEKDLAPSAELREWFGHEPSRFDEFRRHDIEHNDAVVLAEVLPRGLPKGRHRH